MVAVIRCAVSDCKKCLLTVWDFGVYVKEIVCALREEIFFFFFCLKNSDDHK